MINKIYIICPSCGNSKILINNIPEELRCVQCKKLYPIKKGYISLLIEKPDNIPPIDKTMEWKWLIKIYDSVLWRRNILFKTFLGISFSKEKQKILEATNLKGNESILDLACGTGIYTNIFAKKSMNGFVIGFDLSEQMLTYAADKSSKKNLKNIIFIHGNSMDMPFLENSFDLVNCCGALHLFPKIDKVIKNIYKILKPSGRFTGAMVRYPESKYSRYIFDKFKKSSGLTYFKDEYIKFLLEESGFSEIKFLYNKKSWTVFCASK